MNTKAVCEKLNVTPKMLRIYEEQGLIRPKRRENNYREYSAENLLQIETIAILRHLGFSILEIKKLLEFGKTKNEQLDMVYLQYKAVDARIRALRQTKSELMGTVNELLGSADQKSFADVILTERENRYAGINYEDIVTDWNFDEMASDFVNRYLKEDVPYRNTIGRVREIIRGLKGSSFIDIGCGTCNLWQESDGNIDLLAVDLSLRMLLESRKKLPWVNVRMDDVVVMDTGNYDRYDVVVSTFTIHHIEPRDQYKAIDNILKLCKEGGMILLADRCFKSEAARKAEECRLKAAGDTEGLERLNSEYFICADELEEYIRMKKYEVTAEYTDDNMVLYTIIKSCRTGG